MRLAEDDEPQTALLHDENTIFLVAFDDDGSPMGFVFGYELAASARRSVDSLRLRSGRRSRVPAARRRVRRCSASSRAIARARGIATGFVLTSAANEAAMRALRVGRRRAAGRRRRDVGLRVVRGALTTVRPATDADADLLVGWHADPDVSRYWDGETFTREEMLERLARPDVEAFVVEAAGRPVGYLQAWRDGERRAGSTCSSFPDERGRGLGPDAATRARAPPPRRARLAAGDGRSVHVERAGAIRAWRKAGFVDVEERPADDEHSADWLLMVWRGLVRLGIVGGVAVLLGIRQRATRRSRRCGRLRADSQVSRSCRRAYPARPGDTPRAARPCP